MFKTANEADKISCRPVLIFSAVSKIYENKVVADQMYSEFSPSLSPNLSGDLKRHSCCTAMLKMVGDLRLSLANREADATLFTVELIKAFDFVCHALLLAKLRAYGFTDQVLELMRNYL